MALSPAEKSDSAGVASARLPVCAADEMLGIDGGVREKVANWLDRHARLVWAVVIAFYVVGFNTYWRIGPDSALYVSVARNLTQGQGYTYQGEPHTLICPGLPWIMAGLFRVFGAERFGIPNLFILATGIAALALVYRLFQLHTGRPAALAVMVLLAVSETFYRYAFQILTDMPALMGLLAFLAGYEALCGRKDRRGRWYDWLLLGGGVVLIVVMRPTVMTIVPAILVASAWRLWRGERRGTHVAVIMLTVVVFGVFRLFDPRVAAAAQLAAGSKHSVAYVSVVGEMLTNRLHEFVWRAVGDFLPRFFEHVTAEALVGMAIGPGLNTVFAVATLGLGVWLMRRQVMWGMIVLATLGQMFLMLPSERYFLTILPLLLYALWVGLGYAERYLPRQIGGWIVVAMLVLLSGPNLVMAGKLIVEQRSVPFYAHYQNGRYLAILEVAPRLREATGENALILFEQSRVLSYFAQRKFLCPREVLAYRPLEDIRRELAAAPELYVLGSEDESLKQLVERVPLDVGGAIEATGLVKSWELYRARVVAASPQP